MSSLHLVWIFWQRHDEERKSKEHYRMKNESKCRRTPIVRDTWNQIIHEAEGHWIGDQKEDECRIKRKLYFQTSRERHLIQCG